MRRADTAARAERWAAVFPPPEFLMSAEVVHHPDAIGRRSRCPLIPISPFGLRLSHDGSLQVYHAAGDLCGVGDRDDGDGLLLVLHEGSSSPS